MTLLRRSNRAYGSADSARTVRFTSSEPSRLRAGIPSGLIGRRWVQISRRRPLRCSPAAGGDFRLPPTRDALPIANLRPRDTFLDDAAPPFFHCILTIPYIFGTCAESPGSVRLGFPPDGLL